MPRSSSDNRRLAQRRKRFDHGQPISRIDTRPMVFVVFLLVMVISISRFGALPIFSGVDLPTTEAEPIYSLDERFLVTVTTTAIENEAADTDLQSAANQVECRAYLADGTPVSGYELYDYGFTLLDRMAFRSVVIESDPSHNPVIMPNFYVRADKSVPWRCIAGAIYNLQQAGYPTIGFLTEPVV